VIVVANKAVAGAQEVTRKDFEHSIERKVDVVIPFDARLAAQSAKLGQPLARTAKAAKIAQPFERLLALTLEQGGEDGAEDAGGGSLLGKLGGLKSLIAKKPKEAAAGAA